MLLKYIKGNEWELREKITYKEVVVPEGFRTDLASIPRILYPLFLPYGKYIRAAIIHDYLYITNLKNKRDSDRIFYEVMKEDKVNIFIAGIFYIAVSWFGCYISEIDND